MLNLPQREHQSNGVKPFLRGQNNFKQDEINLNIVLAKAPTLCNLIVDIKS